MNRIIAFAVERWQFSLLATVLVTALGVLTFATLPQTEDPQLTFPLYIVTAVLPGANPRDIEAQVTKPIEDALAGLDATREVRSVSSDGVAVVQGEYIWGTETDRKYDEVVREVNALRARLPAGITRLQVERARPSNVPVAQFALTSDVLPTRALDKLARDLRDRFARIPGIRLAEVYGSPQNEVAVALDSARLAAIGLNPGAVVDALRAAGVDTPIGSVNAGDRRFSVRYGGAFPDAAAVAAVPLPTPGGKLLTVGDVAHVAWDSAEPTHVMRFNGHRAVMVTASQADHQDIGTLTNRITAVTDQFRQTLPGSVRLETGFLQGPNVQHRMHLLARDFLLAFVIVGITLLPLGWRAAGVVMIAIPVSLLIGVLVLSVAGFNINQLSVAGFVLSLGLLVDDAIVVIENVSRWLRDGASRTTAAIAGTNQIALAVIGCTACLIFAFLPLIALPEGSGAFIRSMPVAVLGTVAGSLIVALTLIPFIASRLLPRDADPEGNAMLRALHRGIERVYSPLLHRALDRPWPALGLIALIALLAVPLTGAIGSSLFPNADLPQFIVRVEMPRGTALAATDRVVHAVATRLKREPSIAWTVENSGRGSPQIYYNNPSTAEDPALGEVAASFQAWDARTSPTVLARLRSDFAQIPGARIKVIEFVQGPNTEAPVALRMVGPDLAVLTRLADAGETALRDLPQLRDVSNPLRAVRTDLHLTVDEDRARAIGIAPGTLRSAVQLAIGGATPAIVRDSDGDQYPVTVRLPMQGRREIAALDRIFVPTLSGGSVPLSALAHVTLDSGPGSIQRHQRERAVTLTAYVAKGVLVADATSAAIARLNQAVQMPPGYHLDVAGEAESSARSFGGLLPAIVIATVGILAVLVLEFGSFRNVLAVAAVIPLGIFGAVLALWLTGNSLSFTAAVGMIALVGIEIKNSILLVDFTEQLRRDGMPVREAVERAGETRFMPVLLTSITAIGGLLPLAIEGSGLYSPMAITMIGGLVTSTLLARIATPALYLLLAHGGRAAPASAAVTPDAGVPA
ncbi:efflux RND transporter permease subunit [Novosphingobium sp.]|uniref:efflux RND transporter permease subunit n=1 Tax=Novosphingobium sp. TaxID=1874826 RepID=UPI003341C3E5